MTALKFFLVTYIFSLLSMFIFCTNCCPLWRYRRWN